MRANNLTGRIRLVGHIQAHHGELPAGSEHKVGGVRVVPDVGFGYGGHVAGLHDGAAHDDDFLQQLGQLGLQLQRGGEVAQGANSDQGDFTGVGAGHVHNELRGRAGVQHTGGCHAGGQVAQAIATVDEVRRCAGRFEPRGFDAQGHGDLSAGNLGQVQAVGSCLLYGDVAEGGGDTHDIDAGVGQCVIQGHRVIHTGVGVINDFACGFGGECRGMGAHGVTL